MSSTDALVEPSSSAGKVRSAGTLGGLRVPYALPGVLVAAAAVFAWLLYSGRRFTFYVDEWDFVTQARGWGFKDYFVAHNEHWSTVPKLTYRLLLAIFGTRTYVPYLALVLLVHAAIAVVLFLLVRRRAGEVLAIFSAVLMLLVGQGAEDLYWAFQVGFTGSVLFGLIAIYFLQPEDPRPERVRWGLACAALLLALLSSGIGLFFLVVVAVDLGLDRDRRHLLWVLVAPVVAYGTWFLTLGRENASVHRSPLTIDGLRELPSYVGTGVSAALAGMVSFTGRFGAVALALTVAAFAIMIYRSRLRETLAIAALVGMIAQFAFTGLVRAQYGDEQAASSRYVYVAAALGLLVLAPGLRDVPFKGWWRPALIAVVALFSVHDISVLHRQFTGHAATVATMEDHLQAGWALRHAPGLDPEGVIVPIWAPTLHEGAYVRSRAATGSQYPAVTVADLPRLDPLAVNDVVRAVLPPRLVVQPVPTTTTSCDPLVPDSLTLVPGARVEVTDGDELVVVPAGVPGAAPGSTPGAVTVSVGEWALGDHLDGPALTEVVDPGQALWITVPDSGAGLTRQLEVQVPAGAAAAVCRP